MAELTKVALKVENNTQFPNNNSGYITPSRLRGFNTDMIDSTVNQEQYNADSASWNNQINALESFSSSLDNNFVSETQFGAYTSSNDSKVNNLISTASIQESEINALIAFTGSISAVATGSLLVTASAVVNVITFTKGDASTFDVTVGADTTGLNAFTASQDTKNATLASVTASLQSETANLELFTSSANTRLTNLESFTSSQNTKNATLATYTGSNDTKWSNLGSQSGSFVTETESGSFLITASVNLNTITFTKGNNTQFSLTVNTGSGGGGDITALNAFTASQDTKNATLASVTASLITETTNLELFTSSQNTKNSTLATYTGSVDTKFATIANVTSSLNSYTASNNTKWSTLGSISGSWITESETGSFALLNGVNVFTNANTFSGSNSSFSVVGNNLTSQKWFNISGSDNKTRGQIAWLYNEEPINPSGSQSKFTGFTISAVSASKNPGPGFDFKQVAEVNVSTVFGPSLYFEPNGTETGNINQVFFTYSGRPLLGTGAYATQSVVLQSRQVIFRSNDNAEYITFPVSGGVQNDTLVMDANRNMRFVSLNPLNAYTASNDTKWSNLASQSGSWVTESETGSFARTNAVNNFTETQNFTNVTVSGTASVAFLQVTYESSSVIYSSGSNQFGDAADDVQTLYGSVRVMNELTASGLNYPTADNGAKSFIQTDGNGNLSLQYVDTIFETIYAGASVPKGTPLYISGSQGANPRVFAADAADPNKMPVTFIASEAYTINTSYPATVLGLIEGIDLTGYTVGQTVYVAEGGGWTTNLPSGSNSITQVLGVVTKSGAGGKGLVLNPGPAQLPGLQTGYLWVGNGVNQPIAVATSSFIEQPTDITALNAFTASQELLNTTFATTGSNTFKGNQSLSGSIIISGSTLNVVSGSANGNVITNLGDTYSELSPVQTIVTLSSASYAALVSGSLTVENTLYIVSGSEIDLSELNAFTASQELLNTTFATTGSNVFVGTQYISGAVEIYDPTGVDPYPTLLQKFSDGSFGISNGRVTTADGILIPGGIMQLILLNDANSDYNTIIENVDNVGVRFQADVATDAIMELAGYSLNVSNTFTASLTEGYVWVGDSTGRTYEVATSSFGGGGTIDTASFATTGSNEFQANQIITGSLILASVGDPEGFAVTIEADDSISALTFNSRIKSFGIDIPDGEQINFLDSVDADWNTKLGQTDQEGLRIFTAGNVSGVTLTLDNYNLVVSGSARGNVDALSITSNTASIDLSTGNYFTLDLAASATTHITTTNIKPGQTITLLLSTNTNSTVVLAPNILEPSGSFYTASASGSKDIISLVAFDSTTLYAVSTKNMI